MLCVYCRHGEDVSTDRLYEIYRNCADTDVKYVFCIGDKTKYFHNKEQLRNRGYTSMIRDLVFRRVL